MKTRTTTVVRYYLGLLALQFVVGSAWLAHGATYYVATNGTGNGTTISAPMHLTNVFKSGSAVAAGDTVWLRGGLYQVGGKSYRWNCYLAGASNNYITVRNYNNERAIIDGPLFRLGGGAVNWWGLEFTCTITSNRFTSQGGSFPETWWYTNGLGQPDEDYCASGYNPTILTYGDRLINCRFVNCIGGGIGGSVLGKNAEVSGNLLIFNGWFSTADRTHGHGLYLQHNAPDGMLIVRENLSLYNASHGMQFYGTSNTSHNARIERNLFLNNGLLYTNGLQGGRAQTFGSFYSASSNIHFIGNASYFTPYPGYDIGNSYSFFGENGGIQQSTVSSNYMADWSHQWNTNFAVTIEGNTMYARQTAINTNNYPSNTWKGTNQFPTSGAQVLVWSNSWELGRGHVVAFNWGSSATVTADLSMLRLATNQQFEVRNALDYWSGYYTNVYTGAPTILTTTTLTVGQPMGVSTPLTNPAPKFAAWVILPGNMGGAGTNSPSPFPSPVAVSTVTVVKVEYKTTNYFVPGPSYYATTNTIVYVPGPTVYVPGPEVVRLVPAWTNAPTVVCDRPLPKVSVEQIDALPGVSTAVAKTIHAWGRGWLWQ